MFILWLPNFSLLFQTYVIKFCEESVKFYKYMYIAKIPSKPSVLLCVFFYVNIYLICKKINNGQLKVSLEKHLILKLDATTCQKQVL